MGFFKLAKLIAADASDRVGKTTQTKLLVKTLQEFDNKTLYVKLPTKFSFISYKLIYWMLGNKLALTYPYIFHTVQFVNKFLFQVCILPFLMIYYDIIVFDRWSLSALIYGNATGINKKFNKFLFKCMLKPDITFILTRDPIKNDRQHDSYDDDEILQLAVRRAYIDYALKNGPIDVVLIDANDTIEKVHQDIIEQYKVVARIKWTT